MRAVEAKQDKRYPHSHTCRDSSPLSFKRGQLLHPWHLNKGIYLTMGCRSSAPLDVVDPDDLLVLGGERTTTSSLDVLTLADLAAFEDRRRYIRHHRGRRTQDERMADIAALQQSLSAMEDFFQQLVGQTTGFFMEAMDPNNAQLGAGPPPASDAAIASLVCSPLTANELALLHSKMCSVCCEALEVKQLVSRLPCGHVYHPQCVEPWLQKHCTCPSCRYELPTDDDDFEEGRMERMKSRKVPLDTCAHEGDDSSSHSSESQPVTTWDDSNSWGEEGVHLMDGFQGWYEDFREQDGGEEMWVESGVRSRERTQAGWMIRLIDEEVENRATSTLSTARERLNSGDVREVDSQPDDGEPTPKASNVSQRKGRFGEASTGGMVSAVEEDECTKPANLAEVSSVAQEMVSVNVE